MRFNEKLIHNFASADALCARAAMRQHAKPAAMKQSSVAEMKKKRLPVI